jgi:hypothetical protein
MTAKPPTSKALARRMAAGSKASAPRSSADPEAPKVLHRLTLDFPDDLHEALRKGAFDASVPASCLLRAVLRLWTETPSTSAGSRRAVALARAEAVEMRARPSKAAGTWRAPK